MANTVNVIRSDVNATSVAGPKPDASLIIYIRPPVYSATDISMLAYRLLTIKIHRFTLSFCGLRKYCQQGCVYAEGVIKI
jgi:hypothetical protein